MLSALITGSEDEEALHPPLGTGWGIRVRMGDRARSDP
jgi:hypothetical protein